MINVYDVVRKIVGEINPVGETQADDIRYENLKEMCDLADKLLIDIDWIASNYKNNHQSSMKRAAKYASDFYDKLNIKE